ncbi:MAG: hypothetical protein SFY92_00670 [Verrucomicrobiae bacterium]|nr:hypothetical protein [Verrucomicrobiae bacterium]
MRNSITLEVRAGKAPRVLKTDDKNEPVFGDVWAIHNIENSQASFALAVKFGEAVIPAFKEIALGSKFTVTGRLDIHKDESTGIFHTSILADRVEDIVASRKQTQP